MKISLNQALAISSSDLAKQPPEVLLKLKHAAADCLAFATAVTGHVDDAIQVRYGEYALQLCQTSGKDTAAVQFDDGQVRVTADLSLQVEWDQHRLADIARRIQTSGDNPADYIELSYFIAETTFNAWPDSLKTAFSPARTVTSGATHYRLALLDASSTDRREG